VQAPALASHYCITKQRALRLQGGNTRFELFNFSGHGGERYRQTRGAPQHTSDGLPIVKIGRRPAERLQPSAHGVRRAKAALSSGWQAPPGNRSSRKQTGAGMEVTKCLKPSGKRATNWWQRECGGP